MITVKNQIEETERKKITCPECGEEFQDMRGLTSHARHKHVFNKEKLRIKLKNKELKTSNSNILKLISGVGLSILTLFTFGKLD